MRIVLNKKLTRVPPYRPFELTDERVKHFVDARLRECKVGNVKSFIGIEVDPNIEALPGGWLQLLATAYSRHEKVRVAPHDIWFIVMTELAREVGRAPETYRTLFSSAEGGKETILVGTDDITHLPLQSLVTALTDKVNVSVDLFLPKLTTADESVTSALAATFCDMVQSYYNYGTFCCGIPEIEVTGTPEDWAKLASNVGVIKSLFERVDAPQNVLGYLAVLGRLLAFITGDVASGQPDIDFWKGIFTAENVGSGSQLEISGWIKDLYLAKRPNNQLENFTTSFGVVPYFNAETKREFTAIYGAFGQLRSPDGFIYSSYDHLVIERSV